MNAAKLGQNFLIDQNIAKKIVNSIPPAKKYIEIGPGFGALTQHFLNKNLTCIEIDKSIPSISGVNWIYGNALKYNFQTEYIFSNLPYNISTQIMQLCVEKEIPGWTFMMQKEVAERIIANCGKNYGRLSLLMQSRFNLSKLCDVSPTCFLPRPKVWSTVLQGTRKASTCCLKKLQIVSRILFTHRRKCLSNLKDPLIIEILRNLQIDLKLRPENISPDNFWKIVNEF